MTQDMFVMEYGYEYSCFAFGIYFQELSEQGLIEYGNQDERIPALRRCTSYVRIRYENFVFLTISNNFIGSA